MVEVMQHYFTKPENNYASLEFLSGTLFHWCGSLLKKLSLIIFIKNYLYCLQMNIKETYYCLS